MSLILLSLPRFLGKLHCRDRSSVIACNCSGGVLHYSTTLCNDKKAVLRDNILSINIVFNGIRSDLRLYVGVNITFMAEN